MRSHSRRRFLQGSVVLAGISLLSGREVGGQPAAKGPRIGFLAVGSREGRAFLIEGFLQGLRERGYVEGQNIVIEYRFSEDRNDRLPALAAELVAMKVQLILASGTPASFAAKQATSTIPIVMGGIAADPVETGLVASLARPGGNITSMSMMTSPLGGKRLELLKRTVPGLARVAVFWNPPNPAYGPILKELEAAAQTLRLKLQLAGGGPRRLIPAGGDPRGQDPERGQPGRPADGAAHEVRPLHQSEDGPASRPDHSAVGPDPGHSSDPVGDRSSLGCSTLGSR
jgi:ABC-type uncharacterized transport system substrate-binding protein